MNFGCYASETASHGLEGCPATRNLRLIRRTPETARVRTACHKGEVQIGLNWLLSHRKPLHCCSDEAPPGSEQVLYRKLCDYNSRNRNPRENA